MTSQHFNNLINKYIHNLIIVILVSYIFPQEVTLTFDCPNEVVAGSEGNHLFIEMENSITLDAMELYLDSNPNNIIFQDAEWVADHFYVLGSMYNEDSLFYVLPWSGGIVDQYPPGNATVLDLTFNVGNQTGEVEISFNEVIALAASSYHHADIDFNSNCTISVVEPPEDVYLGIGDIDLENQTIEFIMNNIVNVEYIQFSLVGLTVGNDLPDLGGSAVDNGFWSSTNGSTIIFALTGAGGIIPPSEGTLGYYSIESIDSSNVCITEALIGAWPNPPENVVIGDCVSIHQDCTIPYDTNNDGEVNILDIMEVLNFILYNDELDCPTNTNNGVNINDIVVMVNIILGEE